MPFLLVKSNIFGRDYAKVSADDGVTKLGTKIGKFITMLVGAVLQATGSYVLIFFIVALAYLVALLLIQLLVPTLKPAEV